MLIQHREITHPDVTALVLAAEDELFTRYPGTTRSPLDPHARFVVAYVLGRPVGCGALVVSSPGVGEIRRMFVLPAHRRAGVARRILAALERRATAQGWDSIILETGVNQPEAIALYESSGYQRTEPYGRYVDNPYSVCFVKKLLRS
ncbi:GNAT family N-acetyltransferase [Catellatospora citrea]|uniref:N-acetyltransferase n=1 Tax=Catellatospora citrea TaxID=53366 RepID=A0A8J3KH15_9ACTN|nr:GNAT family N-acetyltransferase [Catellatospora citrea]RKE07578.1 acetyltransferase (GNAT) family protein [Catellatospora citrea]GIF95734.1 N-acetyltransferase [Catellatospora citrea]